MIKKQIEIKILLRRKVIKMATSNKLCERGHFYEKNNVYLLRQGKYQTL